MVPRSLSDELRCHNERHSPLIHTIGPLAMNGKRANPFRSRDKVHFPPLPDDLFAVAGPTDGGEESPPSPPVPNKPSIDAANASLDQSFHSRTELNFSVDMSIAGKAELAQHRYHVHKYGIDGIRYELGDGSPGKKGGEGDEWDRIMDDAVSNVSFSSTAIGASKKGAGYHTPSPDHSSDDDSGDSSFFGKAVIQSLVTPEKVRHQLGAEKAGMVTAFRGQACDDSGSSLDNSPERATNVSGVSVGSGFANMFSAALRFHEDFDDEPPSFLKDEETIAAERSDQSGEKDDGRDRSTVVSFAADTSFASRPSPTRNAQQHNSLESNPKGLSASGATPVEKQFTDESIGEVLTRLDFLGASPIQQGGNDNSFGDHMRFVEGMSPPTGGLKENHSAGNLRNLGISPIVTSNAIGGKHKSLVSMPFDERHVTSAIPFDESLPFDDDDGTRSSNDTHQSSAASFGSSAKKRLFSEDSHIKDDKCDLRPLSIEVATESIELVPEKKPLDDQCCTATTVKLEDSLIHEELSSSLSEEVTLSSYQRTFGTNAAFRINSNAADNATCIGNRRGVRLSRLSKLKELGLERALSSPRQYDVDSTF